MAHGCQVRPTTRSPHFATLLVMALDPEEIGKRIETARKKAGYAGHQDFADAVSEHLGRRVNLRTVQRWQKGRNPQTGKSWLPRLDTLMQLADLLEVPSSYFVEAESDPTDHDQIAALRGEVAETHALVRELSERLEAAGVLRDPPAERAKRRRPA